MGYPAGGVIVFYYNFKAGQKLSDKLNKDWQVSGGWEGAYYHYADPGLSKQINYFLLGAKKWFKAKAFELSLDCKSTNIDYRGKNSAEYQSVRLSFTANI